MDPKTAEKVYSVRVLKALLEDCLSDGIESLSEAELFDVLEIRATKQITESFTADEIAQIRLILHKFSLPMIFISGEENKPL